MLLNPVIKNFHEYNNHVINNMWINMQTYIRMGMNLRKWFGKAQLYFKPYRIWNTNNTVSIMYISWLKPFEWHFKIVCLYSGIQRHFSLIGLQCSLCTVASWILLYCSVKYYYCTKRYCSVWWCYIAYHHIMH